MIFDFTVDRRDGLESLAFAVEAETEEAARVELGARLVGVGILPEQLADWRIWAGTVSGRRTEGRQMNLIYRAKVVAATHGQHGQVRLQVESEKTVEGWHRVWDVPATQVYFSMLEPEAPKPGQEITVTIAWEAPGT